MILQIILPTLEQIITETIVLIIVLLIGFSFMGKYAKKRNWENSYIVAIAINFIWFITNLFLGIATYQLFSNGFIIDSILVVINIFVGSIIAIKFLKTSLKEALTLTIITQIVLFAVTYILNEIPNIISIFEIEHPLYEGSKLTFIFSLIIIVAIMSFIMNWGDKIQLIESKNIILLLSILPGIYSIVFAFTTLREDFYLNLGENLILAFIISITLSLVLKKIAYRSIKYEELRELVVL